VPRGVIEPETGCPILVAFCATELALSEAEGVGLLTFVGCVELPTSNSEVKVRITPIPKLNSGVKTRSQNPKSKSEVKIPTLSLQRAEGQGWGTHVIV